MSITTTVTFSDPRSSFAAFYPDLINTTRAAVSRWAQYLDGNAALEIQIDFDDDSPNVLASAGSATSIFIGEWNGIDQFQSGAVYEIATGIDLTGTRPDVLISISPRFLVDTYWFDPTPEQRNPPPPDKHDAFSILLHEIGHALGVIGFRDDITGQLSDNFESPYDAFVTNINGFFYFAGENAVAAYGGPVPLTAENLYHYGNIAPAPGTDLQRALMSGTGLPRGLMQEVSSLDLAILEDIGLPVKGYTVNPGHEVMIGSAGNDVLRGFDGIDALRGGSGNDTLDGGADNDTLLGGTGTDTALFSSIRAAYSIDRFSPAYTVSRNSVADVDTVLGVERLQFADKKVAIDLGPGESAGNAVRLIGAAFDVSFIPQFVGVGITLFDMGLSIFDVAQRALNTAEFLTLAGSRSNVDFVNTVYRNIVGQLPSNAERDFYVGLLQGSGGTMTQAELLATAANVPANELNIGLVGLQAGGIEFV
jgi:hypothetical protein